MRVIVSILGRTNGMGKPEFYAAPCWSSTNHSSNQEEPQQTMLIFGQEMSLQEGMKRMQRDGWSLIRIQPNPRNASSLPVRRSFPVAESFYLFRKEDDRI
jgi:hypothetical protein